ncbi:unnamed protein product [Lasius platythorax]|uniref:Uncharacterized protein n=1 Tax=Lasius platythorax TaxID=488582 RepID=A0AAV2MXY4_9HYME
MRMDDYLCLSFAFSKSKKINRIDRQLTTQQTPRRSVINWRFEDMEGHYSVTLLIMRAGKFISEAYRATYDFQFYH